MARDTKDDEQDTLEGTDGKKKLSGKKGRSLADRIAVATARTSLKKGEHLMDLVLYRNATKTDQVVVDDVGQKHTLLPAGFTSKSLRPDQPQVEFKGGTVILTRQRGQRMVATNVLHEVHVVDAAAEGDYADDNSAQYAQR